MHSRSTTGTSLKMVRFTERDISSVMASIDNYDYGPDEAVSDNIRSRIKTYVASELLQCEVPEQHRSEIIRKFIKRLKEKHDYAKTEPGERINRPTNEAIMQPTSQMALDMKKGKVTPSRPLLKQLDPIFSAGRCTFPEMDIIPQNVEMPEKELVQMAKNLERIPLTDLILKEGIVRGSQHWFQTKNYSDICYRFVLRKSELYLRKLLPYDITNIITKNLPISLTKDYAVRASPYFLKAFDPFIDIIPKNEIEESDFDYEVVKLIKGMFVGGVEGILYAMAVSVSFNKVFVSSEKLGSNSVYYDGEISPQDNIWIADLNKYQMRRFGITVEDIRERFSRTEGLGILRDVEENKFRLYPYIVAELPPETNFESLDLGNISYIKTEGSNFTYVPQLQGIKHNCTMTNNLGYSGEGIKEYGLDVLGIGPMPYHMSNVLDQSFLESSGKTTRTKRRAHNLMIQLTSTGRRTGATFYGMKSRDPDKFYSLGLNESATVIYKNAGLGAYENTSRDSTAIALGVLTADVDFSVKSKFLAENMERDMREYTPEKFSPISTSGIELKSYKPKVPTGTYIAGIPQFIVDALSRLSLKINKARPRAKQREKEIYTLYVTPFDNPGKTKEIMDLLEIEESENEEYSDYEYD